MAETIENLKSKVEKLQKEVAKLKSSVKKKKFGLVWMDVPEAFEDDVENKLPILKEVPDKAIVNDDDKPTHILIEGDNYHALTCLNYTHKEKVDIIYIDPPYNTGTDGFKYKDKRILDKYPDGTEVPKDHPFRHSYWLSFMAKRLELAKNLLKDSGVIFISIDDNEAAQLKLLSDMIFGQNNYVGTITWERKRKGSHLSKKFTKKTEFVLIYAKEGEEIELYGADVGQEEDSPLIKRTNAIKELNIPKERIYTKLKDGVYKAGKYGKGSSAVELLEDIEVKDNHFLDDLRLKGPFIWQQSMVDKEAKNGAKFFIKTMNFSLRALKHDLSESFKALSSLLTREVGTNEDAKTEVSRILGVPEDKLKIDYPKPVSYIKKLLKAKRVKNGENLVVVDFFAGSGTTGHAVMQLNDESGQNHQFIIVTNNEGEIMDEVCYPRINNVINGYEYEGKYKRVLLEKPLNWSEFKKANVTIAEVEKIIEQNNESGEWEKISKGIDGGVLKVIGEKVIQDKVEGIGNSIKYYKTDFVGKHNVQGATDKDKIELAHYAGDLLAIAENTLYKVEENNFWQVYENCERYTAVYFREELDEFEKFVEKVEAMEYPVTVYVFSWGDDEFTEEFEHIEEVKVKTIPLPILEIYKSIYNLG